MGPLIDEINKADIELNKEINSRELNSLSEIILDIKEENEKLETESNTSNKISIGF